MHNLIENYQHSVRNVNSAGQQTLFYETVSLENLDAESKKLIIFGNKTDVVIKPDNNTFMKIDSKDNSVKKYTPSLYSTGKNSRAFKFPENDSNIKKPRVVTNKSKERLTGTIKVFYTAQNFGFVKVDSTAEELFFHYEDAKKANITKEFLESSKNAKVSFTLLEYVNNYNIQRKAIDIELMDYSK